MVLLGVAEDSPDELEIGAALLLLAFTAPILWLAMRHLRGMPAVPERPDTPIDPAEGHRFSFRRIAGPALGLSAAALASIVALVIIDGDEVRARLERFRAQPPAPMPELETPELPDPATAE
jgi:hypothetical protein